MSVLRLLPVESRREQPWMNGAGTTTELARDPAGADWRWRLSIARIDRDAPFSPLPHVRRQLLALDAPLALRFDDGREQTLPRLAVIHFEGAEAPRAHLPAGPSRVFNLMLRESAQGELLARPLVGAMLLPMRASTHCFVYLASGRAELRVDGDHFVLEADALCEIHAPSDPSVHIDGNGELVLARLQA